MSKFIKNLCFIIVILIAKQSFSLRYECTRIEFKVECKNTNIESIKSILNSSIEIESLDVSYNK